MPTTAIERRQTRVQGVMDKLIGRPPPGGGADSSYYEYYRLGSYDASTLAITGAFDELNDVMASSIDGLSGEQAVFDVLKDPKNSKFWVNLAKSCKKEHVAAALSMLGNLTRDHQKSLALNSAFLSHFVEHIDSNYSEPGASLTLYLAYLQELNSCGALNADDILGLVEHSSINKSKLMASPHCFKLLGALLIGADTTRANRCLAIWRWRNVFSNNGTTESYYRFLEQCLINGGDADTVVQIAQEEFVNLLLFFS